MFTGIERIAIDPPLESSVASTHGTSSEFDWPDDIAANDMATKRTVMKRALIPIETRSMGSDKKRSDLSQLRESGDGPFNIFRGDVQVCYDSNI